ncbi:MAG: DMT family transporter [Planctomycetota bacterium]
MQRVDDEGRAIPLVCLGGVVLSWGLVPVFIRYFTGFLDAWTVNVVRYSAGALFWLPYVVWFHRRLKTHGGPRAGRSVWLAALVPTAVNAVGQTGYALSPYFVSASVIGFGLRMSFVFTLLFGFVFIAEERRLGRRPVFWLGAALCLGGVVLMFLDSLLEGGRASLIGMLLLVGTTFAWGGYAVSVRTWMAPYPIRLSFGVISLYTTAVLVVLALVMPEIPAHPVADASPADGLLWRARVLGRQSPSLWVALVGSGLLDIAFGHVMYYRGIHRFGPVVAGGVILVTPLVTYSAASLTLGETMAWTQWLGGALVLGGGGLLLVARSQLERALASEASAQPS